MELDDFNRRRFGFGLLRVELLRSTYSHEEDT